MIIYVNYLILKRMEKNLPDKLNKFRIQYCEKGDLLENSFAEK